MRTPQFATLTGLAISLALTSRMHAASAPVVITIFPSNITASSATLNGSVNPNGSPTIAYFQWGTTTNYGTATPTQSIGSGSSFVPVQVNLSPLLTDTNYHYRLVASNALGIVYGSNVIVTPTSLLYLYAGESWSYEFRDFSSTNIQFWLGGSFASANFAIAPGSFAPGSSARFEMFENTTNDPTTPASSQVINAPANSASLSQSPAWADRQGVVRVTALTGSIVVSSVSIQRIPEGSGGSLRNFYYHSFTPTRLPQPPTLGTQFVSGVTTSSATVNWDINARNLNTGAFVEWGTTTNYGATSAPVLLNSDYLVRRAITVSNLAPNTAYHFRVFATNSVGTTYGYDLPLASGVVRPRITKIVSQPISQVWLQATGAAGFNYTFESAHTLSNWVDMTNILFPASGTLDITQDVSGITPRFYRIRWP